MHPSAPGSFVEDLSFYPKASLPPMLVGNFLKPSCDPPFIDIEKADYKFLFEKLSPPWLTLLAGLLPP